MWRLGKKHLPLLVGLMLFAFALYRFDSLLALIFTFFSIISPFIIGFFVALIINLPMRLLDRLLSFMDRSVFLKKFRRGISLTLSVGIVAFVISLLFIVIIPEVIAAVERLIKVIPGLLKDLEIWVSHQNESIRNSLGLVETNEQEVRSLFEQAYRFLIGGLTYSSGVVVSTAQFLISFIVSLVFAIYLLFSKENIQDQVSRLTKAALPPKASHHVQRIVQMLVKAYANFISGQILQAFLSSFLTVAVLLVFGFPYAVLIGLITFAASFIPVFGPYLSGILGMLLVLTVEPGQTLWFLLAFFIVQQVAGSVIYPRIMSSAIDIPSIWVLVAVTIGGGVMGIAGMLLFIPLMAVAYHLTAEFVHKREMEKEKTAREKFVDIL